MALSDITREAVLAAIARYDELGRQHFLDQYGFQRARQYTLVYQGMHYDSKAIVGVAHGYLPGEDTLSASEFSGGRATVAPLLTRLGFQVDEGNGEAADNLVHHLEKLRFYRKDGVPALYQPITLLWAFSRARRGADRLVSWAETKQQVGALLHRYGQTGEGDRVHYPVAALYGAGLWELDSAPASVPTAHGSSVPQRWFNEHQPAGGLIEPVYNLIRESPEALSAAVSTLVTRCFTAQDPSDLLAALGLSEPGEASPLLASFAERPEIAERAEIAAEYQRLCQRADFLWRDRDENRAERTSAVPVRAQAARLAVLLRCEGHCENPQCTGEVRARTDRGDPIVEVDHIHDLALGGPDDPAQMIALCPNCHATKTRGSTRHALKETLLAEARRRHDELSGS